MAIQTERTGRLFVALVAPMLLSSMSLAGETWDGGGRGNNWTEGPNWSPSIGLQVPPPNDGTASIVMAGTTGLTPNVNVPYSIHSLSFNTTAGAFVIFGEQLTIGAGGVVNNAFNIESIFAPIRLAADQQWTANFGLLQIDAVDLNGFDLTFEGILPTDLLGVIHGDGNLLLPTTYDSRVTMAGPGSNTYTGVTSVEAGTLILSKTSGAVAVPGELRIGLGSGFAPTVRLGADEQISHAPGNVVQIYQGAVTEAGLLDLNGHIETLAVLELYSGAVTTGSGKLVITESIVGGGTITGNVDLNGGMPSIARDFAFSIFPLVIDGVISNGGVVLDGVTLQGPANTYSGTTLVTGDVRLNKSGVDGAFRGDVTIQGSTVYLQANEQILAAAGNQVLIEFGNLDLGTFSETIQDLRLKDADVDGSGSLTVLGTIENTSDVLSGSFIFAPLNLAGMRQFNIHADANPNATDVTVRSVVSNGSVVKTGSGRLRLENANNTYAGDTFINEGTIFADRDGSLGAATGAIHFDGGVLGVEGFNFSATSRPITWGPNGGGFDVTIAGGVFTLPTQSLSGPGPLTKLGPGKLVLVAPQSYTGGTTVSGGTLEGNTQTLQGNILNNATLAFDQASDGTYAGNLAGTGTLSKQGAGILDLNGDNTYTGATTINAGTLRVGHSNAMGNLSAVMLADVAGARLDLDSSNLAVGSLAGGGAAGGNVELGSAALTTGGNDTSTTYAGIISGSGGVTKVGTGTWTLTGNNTYSGGTTFAAGSVSVAADANLGEPAGPLRFDGGTFRATGAFATTPRSVELLAGGGGLDVANAANSFTYAGNITGPGGLTKLGTATLVLEGNNSYGGATSINAGTLRTVGGNAIPDGSALTLADAVGALLDLDGTNETIGSLAGGGPTGGNLVLGAGTLTTGGNNSSTTFAGAISGSGGLIKTGAGAFMLAGSNAYTGLSDVQQGTLRLGANDGVPQNNSIHVASGATFDLNGFAKTLSSLTGDGQVTLGAGQLTLGANDASSSFGGGISESGALVKTGAGTLTLDGANSYTGGTTVVAGLLRGPAGGLQGDILNQATVEFAQTFDGTYSGQLSGPGGVVKTGPGRTTIATAATYTGATTVSEGTLTLLNTLNTPGGAIAIEANGTLEASGVVQRAIAGAGQLTAIGNLVAGDLTSTSGFDLGGGANIGSHSVVLLDADQVDLGGGTIAGGSLATLNGLELSGTFGGDGTVNGPFVNNGVVAGPAAPAALTFTGPVSGAGSFTGNIRILDSFSPGNGAAAVSFEHISLGDQALLTIELGGSVSGIEYDTLSATGTALLDGALQVTFINGFSPQAVHSFDILDWTNLSGTFDTLSLPALGAGLIWDTTQLYTDGILAVVSTALAGDYNSDGVVDAADYVVWRKNEGTTNMLPNDPLGGTIDSRQYGQWRANFGRIAASGATAGLPSSAGSTGSASAAVPEPSALALVALALVLLGLRRK